MGWDYSETTVDRLYGMWGKLGWRNTVGVCSDEVDIEKLISETTHAARYDGRLLPALMTWVRDYGDLIDKEKLLRYLKQADTAVLGAVLDIAMRYGGNEDFTPIIGVCRPQEPMEILIKGFDDVEMFAEWQKEYAKEEFLKWGFYSATIDFYDDAFRTREWILKSNNISHVQVFE